MADDNDEDMTLEQAEAEPVSAPAAPPSVPLPQVAVVGVGLTTLGLTSLEVLFASASTVQDIAWVVTTRQAESIDIAQLVETLSRVSPLAVEIAAHGVRPQPNRIYVAPNDQLMTFGDGALQMEPAEQALGERGAMDSFFVSLAETNGRAAVCVLLAGLGAEGGAGVMALKDGGGVVVCEREAARSEELHPLSDPTGLADFVLDASDIAARVGQYIRHLRNSPAGRDEQAAEEQIADQIGRIAAVLRNRTGHDFHGYKHGTFLRRIARRMQVNAIDKVEDYIAFLRDDADEVHHLFQDLLIGVTHFFRDKAEFDLLEREVVPRLFEGKGAGDHVRVWVLGCSTGEEAYSIALLLREHMDTLEAAPTVQIFATDIDGRALTVARAGRYPDTIAAKISPERLLRWFTKEGITYRVNKELREMCIFSQHNIIKDAPFSRIDLCSCRNLLIYLNASLQDRVIPLFHFALRGQGYLFLGSSENVTRHQRLFSPLDRQRRIFRRLDTGVRVLPDFPLSLGRARGNLDTPSPGKRPDTAVQLGRQAERVVERHAPAYVLVDPSFEVLSFSGRTGRFLEPASGSANLNVLNLVHRDLRMDLRAALQRASLDKSLVKIDRIAIDSSEDSERRRVDLIVEPLPGEEPAGYVVLFRDAGAAAANDDDLVVDAAVLRDEHVQRLEGDLRLTRERLQATIEELESTNEELKSSNEEYQSVNEELQSANEELETSKEELQSVNEELHTVNSELAQRVSELGRANSDLKNLLESTQIATVFLDHDLRVKGFTPAMSDVFHLIETDLGRPLNHIAARIAYPEMQDDVRRVLRTLTIVEREVGGTADSRYQVRVLPYRSLENYIAGVVMTFLDVTKITNAETDLRRGESRLRTIAHLVPDLLWSSGTDGTVDWLNKRWTDYTGQVPGTAIGAGWLEVIHPEERAAFGKAYFEAAHNGEPYRNEHRLRALGGEYRWFRINAQAIEFESEGMKYFGAATEIDGFKRADDRQRLLVAELQHRVKNIMAVVRSISGRSLETSGTLEEFSAHFSGRLDALARTQGVIARRGDEGVELEDLVRDEIAASAPVNEERVRVFGPPVMLKDKAAEVFALSLHELATNAVKYGALSVPAGRVSIEWRLMNTSEGRRLSLEWRESGVPVLISHPKRTGFGRDLIEQGLPYDLDAVTSLDFAPGGVRCTVELPLGERVVALESRDLEA